MLFIYFFGKINYIHHCSIKTNISISSILFCTLHMSGNYCVQIYLTSCILSDHFHWDNDMCIFMCSLLQIYACTSCCCFQRNRLSTALPVYMVSKFYPLLLGLREIYYLIFKENFDIFLICSKHKVCRPKWWQNISEEYLYFLLSATS